MQAELNINTLCEATMVASSAEFGIDKGVEILKHIDATTERVAVDFLNLDSIRVENDKLMVNDYRLTSEGLSAISSKGLNGTTQMMKDIFKLTEDPAQVAGVLKASLAKKKVFDPTFTDVAMVVRKAPEGLDFEGKIEAVHGKKYAYLSNAEAFEMTSGVLGRNSEMKIDSWNITGRRANFDLLDKNNTVKIEGTSRVGDVIASGFRFQNSEDGSARYLGSEYLQMLACTNGMVSNKSIAELSRVHRGTRESILRDVHQMLNRYTIKGTETSANGRFIDLVQDSVTKVWSDGHSDLAKKVYSDILSAKEVDQWLALTDLDTVFNGFNKMNDASTIGKLSIANRHKHEDLAVDFLRKSSLVTA